MTRTTLALAAALTLAPAAAALADPPHPVHDGKWEVTTQTEIPGMPFHPPPSTHTQCITKKDAVPHNPRQKDCTLTEMKQEGGHVSWKVKCTGAHPAEGSGEITYHGDSFEGRMVLKTTNPRTGQPMEMTHSMQGKRVGDCDAK